MTSFIWTNLSNLYDKYNQPPTKFLEFSHLAETFVISFVFIRPIFESSHTINSFTFDYKLHSTFNNFVENMMRYVKLYKFHGSQEDHELSSGSCSQKNHELADHDKQKVKRFKAAMQRVILKFESKKSHVEKPDQVEKCN